MADARAQTRTPVDLAPVTWWFMVRTMVGARIRAQAGFRSSFAADLASQLLLAATLRMLRVAGITTTARRRLQRLHLAFAEVTPPSRGVPTPAWRPTRLNARYVNALRLAEVILAAQSFEHHAGDLVRIAHRG